MFHVLALTAQDLHKRSGIVLDSANRIPLISANILIEGTKLGTLTNSSGWFSIELSGRENIRVSLVGYNTKIINSNKLLSSESPYIIYLAEKPVLSNEVVVETESRREKSLQLMGYEQLTTAQIKYSPSFGGESDIIKTMQLLPGVTTANEISTRINVRGGEPDQNQILIDGIQAYNPTHLMNFVSSFNTDAISNVELLKGSIPAEYYGKLSSVLKINLKEGNNHEHKWGGGISFLSSQLYAEGPINSNFTYMVSARRTYFDLMMSLANMDVGYSFTDLYGKAVFHAGQKDIFYLSGYWGLDRIGELDEKSSDDKLKWGNYLVHFKYNRLWNSYVFSDFSASYSKYFNDLQWKNNDKHPYLADYSIKNITDINLSNMLSFKTGADYHFFNFNVAAEAGEDYKINVNEVNAFFTSKYKYNDNFISDIGITASWFSEDKTKQTYSNIEPRVTLCYLADKDMSYKFSYTMMHQYIHAISPYTVSELTDILYPSTKGLPGMKGSQITIGTTRLFNLFDSDYDMSIDLYYKDMKNVPDLKYRFKNADPYTIGDQIVIGKGWSYGVELQINKSVGRINGWLNYTWNDVKRLFPGKNNDKSYAPKFDKAHQMNLALNYSLSDKLRFGATYILASGQPLTLATQKYYIGNNPYIDYGVINGYRLPYYSRLDVNIVHFFNMWGGKWELSGSIFNLLMRKNPTFLYYDFEKGDFKKTSLGLIPTVGLKFHY